MKMVSGVTMIFLGQEAVVHDMMLYIQSQGSRAKSPKRLAISNARTYAGNDR